MILRVPDPADAGNEPSPQNPPSNPPPPAPAPPPATEVVITGEKSERELRLEEELERERQARKKDQTKLCELEDENHHLKKVVTPSATPARGKNKSAGPISSFFGWEEN